MPKASDDRTLSWRREGQEVSKYQPPGSEQDPVYLIRTIGRLAQMLLEIRDEYVLDPREDTLDQFERRLDEIAVVHQELRALRESREDEIRPTASQG